MVKLGVKAGARTLAQVLESRLGRRKLLPANLTGGSGLSEKEQSGLEVDLVASTTVLAKMVLLVEASHL